MRPERLSAKRSKAAKHLGQVSWLEELLDYDSQRSNQQSHHSGATARDFHPFPYSPHLPGHPDAFKFKELSKSSGRYHAFDERVKYLPGVADEKQSRGRERLRPVLERVEDFPFFISYLSVVICRRRDAQMENEMLSQMAGTAALPA